MIVSGGGFFAPFKLFPGVMVLDEIDTCTLIHRISGAMRELNVC